MLKPLERQRCITIWDDSEIESGTKWADEIKKAIAAVKVGIFMVSPDFAASDFIAEHELPVLLSLAEKNKVRIAWVLISHCLYDLTGLDSIQALHDVSKPLDTLPPARQRAVLVEICKRIDQLIQASQTP